MQCICIKKHMRMHYIRIAYGMQTDCLKVEKNRCQRLVVVVGGEFFKPLLDGGGDVSG